MTSPSDHASATQTGCSGSVPIAACSSHTTSSHERAISPAPSAAYGRPRPLHNCELRGKPASCVRPCFWPPPPVARKRATAAGSMLPLVGMAPRRYRPPPARPSGRPVTRPRLQAGGPPLLGQRVCVFAAGPEWLTLGGSLVPPRWFVRPLGVSGRFPSASSACGGRPTAARQPSMPKASANGVRGPRLLERFFTVPDHIASIPSFPDGQRPRFKPVGAVLHLRWCPDLTATPICSTFQEPDLLPCCSRGWRHEMSC